MTRLRHMAFIALAILAGAGAGAGPALARPVADFKAAWAKVEARYRDAAAKQKVVGSSLYFMHDGAVIGRVHYGLEDIASGRPIDADTIYHWASITKTFTAVAAMQLVERGLISLDDPVSRYLPEIREVHNPFGSADAITLRHLITHTSGLRSATFPWGGQQAWQPHEPTDWSQVAAMMPYSEIEFGPGSRYSYSNLGLSMLGRVVEKVSGDDIEVYVAKNIFMPLGMTRSYFDHTPYYLREDRSNNYLISDGVPAAQGLDFDTGATAGNGGINGPVGDMVKWLNFWLDVEDNGHYRSVLSRATLEAMWQPVQPTDKAAGRQSIGMSFFLIDQPAPAGQRAVRYVGHTGSQKAFVAFVYVDPQAKSAAIFASNTVDPALPAEDALLRKTRRDLFENLFPVFSR